MHSNESMRHEIVRFIRDEIAYDNTIEIAGDENLFTSGLLDSIGVMRLIEHLQATYRYQIPPQDLVPSHFQTIDAMTAYLQSKVSAS